MSAPLLHQTPVFRHDSDDGKAWLADVGAFVSSHDGVPEAKTRRCLTHAHIFHLQKQQWCKKMTWASFGKLLAMLELSVTVPDQMLQKKQNLRALSKSINSSATLCRSASKGRAKPELNPSSSFVWPQYFLDKPVLNNTQPTPALLPDCTNVPVLSGPDLDTHTSPLTEVERGAAARGLQVNQLENGLRVVRSNVFQNWRPYAVAKCFPR